MQEGEGAADEVYCEFLSMRRGAAAGPCSIWLLQGRASVKATCESVRALRDVVWCCEQCQQCTMCGLISGIGRHWQDVTYTLHTSRPALLAASRM